MLDYINIFMCTHNKEWERDRENECVERGGIDGMVGDDYKEIRVVTFCSGLLAF